MSERTVLELPERPLLRPWVSLDPGPVLYYANAKGKICALDLDPIALASLALSIAEAQTALSRRDLNAAVQPCHCTGAKIGAETTYDKADRG